MNHYDKHIFVCTNQKMPGKKCCARSGGDEYFSYLKSRLLDLNLHGPGQVRVSRSGCLGRCAMGPCIVIYPEGVWYRYESYTDIDQIIESHILKNTPVSSLLIDNS